MEQTTKHKTCAVVVTHNRRALLERCLAALKQQSAPCDVLVVDNASTTVLCRMAWTTMLSVQT